MIKYFFIIAQKKWLFKPLSYDCIFKTTYMYLLIANRFVESILTCVPIRSFFHGLAAKAASPVLLATPAGVISRLCRSMSFASQMFSLYHKWFSTSKLVPPHFCYILPASSACWSSPHPISNSQLHVLPHFHLCPIYLVVFKGVYFTKNGISHLEGGFTLRCLQRLSLPDLATRPWLWQANRSTSGPSIPVLSY